MSEDYDGPYGVTQYSGAPGTSPVQIFSAREDRCALILSGSGTDTVTYNLGNAGTLAGIVINTTTGPLVLTRASIKDLITYPVQAKTQTGGTVIGAIEVYELEP